MIPNEKKSILSCIFLISAASNELPYEESKNANM